LDINENLKRDVPGDKSELVNFRSHSRCIVRRC